MISDFRGLVIGLFISNLRHGQMAALEGGEYTYLVYLGAKIHFFFEMCKKNRFLE